MSQKGVKPQASSNAPQGRKDRWKDVLPSFPDFLPPLCVGGEPMGDKAPPLLLLLDRLPLPLPALGPEGPLVEGEGGCRRDLGGASDARGRLRVGGCTRGSVGKKYCKMGTVTVNNVIESTPPFR